LHMGMHVALREQHGADRPPGVRDVYERLVRAQGDRHQAEHAMMDCLGEAMWTAQRTGTEADLNGYLGCLRRQLPGGALFSR
ncbi:MAG: DUF1841 family protein, partial [Chromatiales bacterium]|nr:DUF1841 family protein [Chromatiales bacterium]